MNDTDATITNNINSPTPETNVIQQFDLDRALNRIKRQINLGFSDENYATISWLMGLIQPHVDPESHRQLSGLWRDTYAGTADQKALNRVIREMRPESSY